MEIELRRDSAEQIVQLLAIGAPMAGALDNKAEASRFSSNDLVDFEAVLRFSHKSRDLPPNGD